MKQFFAGALLISCLSLPASAASIELIDNMVTGTKGSASIIIIGKPVPCIEAACVDASGGDAKMSTASAAKQASLQIAPPRKINFDFARKYPDPANPVAVSAPESSSGESGGLLDTPTAPADSGTVAQQPPVQPQPDSQAMGGPSSEAPVNATRGSIDANSPVMPIASTEASEGE